MGHFAPEVCGVQHTFLFDPIYDLSKHKYLRSRALFYIHGHSTDGSYPLLAQALHYGKTVLPFDCNYNRRKTEDKALFFKNSDEMVCLTERMEVAVTERVGRDMADIAGRRHTWRIVAQQSFVLLGA